MRKWDLELKIVCCFIWSQIFFFSGRNMSFEVERAWSMRVKRMDLGNGTSVLL